MKKESGALWKLGMFVVAGLVLLIASIYFIGKQKNLFGSTIHLRSEFKTVSGLKVGNNVRFAGINIGTVDAIELKTDTTVMVTVIIKKEVQQFIKADSKASIGSDGLMGDKVLTISPGVMSNNYVKDNSTIESKVAIEMDDVMNSIKKSVDNAGIITGQLAEFSFKMNNSNGALSKLISDESFSESLNKTMFNLQNSSGQLSKFTGKLSNSEFTNSLDSTMSNIKGATKGLNENMEAVKHNILFRGYFKKQKKAQEKKAKELKNKTAEGTLQKTNAKDSTKR